MKHLKWMAFGLATSLFFAACTKNNGDANSGDHSMAIRMTDAPFDAQQVNVDIRQVQVHTNNDPDGGWVELAPVPGVYNLLDYQNNKNVLIAQGPVPSPIVTEIRFILGTNNSIMIDNVLLPLTIPSGSESGLKVKFNKTLTDPLTTVIIDFDAGLSVHKTGNDKYILKPVLQVK